MSKLKKAQDKKQSKNNTSNNILISELNFDTIKNGNVEITSNETYKSVLRVLKREVGNFKLKDMISIINHQKKKVSDSKLKNQIIVLIKFYKELFSANDNIFGNVSAILRKLDDTIENKVKGVSRDEIGDYKKIIIDVKKKVKNPPKNMDKHDLITLYLYTSLPTRRADNRFLRVFNRNKKSDKFPYINTTKKIIFYPPHKTNIPVKIDIKEHVDFLKLIKKINLNGDKLYNDTLSRGLEDSLREYNNSQKAYSVYVKKIFNKYYNKPNYTIQKVRRLYVAKDAKIIDNLKEQAKQAGHSLHTHIENYAKIKEEIEK